MDHITNRSEVTFSAKQEEYLKKEFDKLNTELQTLLNETRTRERYSLTIIAGIATWIFTSMYKIEENDQAVSHTLYKAISFIPIITTLLYAISVWLIYKNIKWIGRYLKRIENHFLSNSSGQKDKSWGWEEYFDSENKKSLFVNVTIGIWCFQLLLALSIVILVFCFGSKT